MKTILITGAAGFLGSHMVEKLIKAGNHLIGVDNFITGTRENVERLMKIANESAGSFEFIEYDITDPQVVPHLMGSLKSVDEIYQMACPASPKDFDNLSREILEVCSLGNIHILKVATHFNARFLFTSTSEVYGDPLVHPQPESYNGNVSITGERSCYDEGKRFAESYIINYSKKHNIDYRIARIFNTYGPYMRKDDGRVIPNFIEQINSGKPVTIYGDGTQTRSFCYVDDMCDGLQLLMEYDFKNNLEGSEIDRILNIGNAEEVSMLTLANLLFELAGKKCALTHIELPQNDPKQRKPDLKKIEGTLSFKATTPLKVGLGQTLEAWNI